MNIAELLEAIQSCKDIKARALYSSDKKLDAAATLYTSSLLCANQNQILDILDDAITALLEGKWSGLDGPTELQDEFKDWFERLQEGHGITIGPRSYGITVGTEELDEFNNLVNKINQ